MQKAAQQAVASKRFSEARELYKRLAAREPANADYLVWIGQLSSWMNEFPAAITAYDRALALSPKSVDALLGKSYVLMWQHDYENASALLAKAEEIAPQNADVELAWANYHHYQGHEGIAKSYVHRALDLRPDNEEAKALESQLVMPRPIEIQLGYGHDTFSFVPAGNVGSLGVGYVTERSEVVAQFEAWNRFGQHVNRLGFNAMHRFGERWWVHGGALWGLKATVLPRQEFSAGITRSLPHGLVAGGDYGYLGFSTASVHIFSPSLEYYFKSPAWVHIAYYRSRTSYRTAGNLSAGNGSILLQYNLQATDWLIGQLGFAHGNESFARGNESFVNLPRDQLARFQANTYITGVQLKLSPALSVGPSYSYQRRVGGEKQTSLGISVTLKP